MADVEIKDVNHIHELENFVQGAIDYLPSDVFQTREQFMQIFKIFMERLSFVDKKMVELAEYRTLALAEGDNLDEIGRQEGIFRNGLNDPEYRAVIMILSGNNSKSGTRSDVIATLKQLFGDDGVTTFKGHNYRVDINIFNACVEVKQILDEIIDMMPMVTHLRIVESRGYPFGFKGDDQAIGFGSVFHENKTGVGGIASLIYVSDDEDPYR